jgi:hypothetical protein
MNRSFWRKLLFFIPFVPLLMSMQCSKLNLSLGQESLSVVNGGAAQTTIVNIIRENVNGVVSLSATNVPTGVNVSFNPASTTGNSSSLNVAATNTATVGSSVITVTGTAPGFTSSQQLSLTVTAAQTLTKPVIAKFTATPNSLPAPGGNVLLEWDVQEATSLSIDQGVGTLTPVTTGSKSVNFTSSKTFILTATNANGSSTASVNVTVGGGLAAGVWDQSNWDGANWQ